MEEKVLTGEDFLLNPGKLLEQENPKYQLLVDQLDQWCQRMTNRKHDFIGSHPYTMELRHLNDIWMEQKNYLVCEKTDGVRYIVLVMSSGEIYFTGRKTQSGGVRILQFFQVNITLPSIMFEDDDFKIKYMFDGELCQDCYVNSQNTQDKKRITRLFIFDTMVSNYEDTFEHNLIIRLKTAQNFKKYKKFCKGLIKDRMSKKIDANPLKTQSFKRFRKTVSKLEKIRFIVKDFFYFDQCPYLLNYYIPNCPHQNDGLIFTKISSPYVPGGTEDIIKWKPPHMNTIDFCIVINDSLEQYNIVDMYVIQGQHLVFFDFMIVSEEFVEDLKEKKQMLQNEQANNMEVESDNEDQNQVKGVICECNFTTLNQEKLECLSDYKNMQIDQKLQLSHFGDQVEEKSRRTIDEIDRGIKRLNHEMPNFGWSFEKYRLDKSKPNASMPAINILKTLRERIDTRKIIEKVQDKVGLQQLMRSLN